MEEPRSLKPCVLLQLMHTCIVFRRAFISPPTITTEHQLYCLFGWKHKWSALIPFSFIAELGYCKYDCRKNGSNYSKAMPPCDSTAQQDDEVLKVRGRGQSKTPYCLLLIQKLKWKTFLAVIDNGSLGISN